MKKFFADSANARHSRWAARARAVSHGNPPVVMSRMNVLSAAFPNVW
jgi:hypothetical protein